MILKLSFLCLRGWLHCNELTGKQMTCRGKVIGQFVLATRFHRLSSDCTAEMVGIGSARVGAKASYLALTKTFAALKNSCRNA